MSAHLSPVCDDTDVISVTLNGEPVTLERCTVSRLLESRELAGKRIAVERNGEIVPKSMHASTAIERGDRIEIVVAVGGG